MSAAREPFERPDDDAAMATVLAAERRARDALEESRRRAAGMLEAARVQSKAIATAAARRAGAIRTCLEARLAARLSRIDSLECEALAAGEVTPQERARLARAVERLAAELTREAEPS